MIKYELAVFCFSVSFPQSSISKLRSLLTILRIYCNENSDVSLVALEEINVINDFIFIYK